MRNSEDEHPNQEATTTTVTMDTQNTLTNNSWDVYLQQNKKRRESRDGDVTLELRMWQEAKIESTGVEQEPPWDEPLKLQNPWVGVFCMWLGGKCVFPWDTIGRRRERMWREAKVECIGVEQEPPWGEPLERQNPWVGVFCMWLGVNARYLEAR